MKANWKLFWSNALALLGFLFVAWVAKCVTPLPIGLDDNSDIKAIQTWAGPQADISTYLDYARDLFDDGRLQEWYPSGFPPGMAFVDGLLEKLTGPARFASKLRWLSVVTWGAALFFFYWALSPWFSRLVLFLLLNAFWLLPSSRAWAMGIGSLMSETRAHPLFLIAIALFVLGLNRGKNYWFYAGAFTLGLCAYLRVYFEKLGLFVFGLFLLLEIVRYLRKQSSRSELARAAILLALFQLALFPWCQRNKHDPRIKTYAMAPAQMHITFYHLWESTEATPEILGSGANTACLSDPELCASLHGQYGRVIPDGVSKRSAIKTLLRHPIKWYQLRMSHLTGFWIGHQRTFAYAFEGILTFVLLLAMLLLAPLLLFSRGTKERFWASLVLGFAAFNFAVFTFAGMDIDGRHSVTMRFFAYFVAVWTLAELRGAVKSLRIPGIKRR